ncbi:general transcription factor II-I repeat domain-containing protein 2A-like [Centruroides sculpturatus]|uniref:general transcription factor II-I repeat domain-containing protein 2A-like n=1 Tax=Centruroides sculpturatus TaxID=218467 RepID=UPI000C6D1635|nr:general transcription factor II-I repeat domain-containing protein 2A-like [Centruroides sculpturatus]
MDAKLQCPIHHSLAMEARKAMDVGPPRKKKKNYRFHEEWEYKYLFTVINEKCTCMICRGTIAISKKSNLERHFTTMHKQFPLDFPEGSNLRSKIVNELKNALHSVQPASKKPVGKLRRVAEASFKIAHLLVKHKKPFTDGAFVKEAMLLAAESLFADRDDGDELTEMIRGMPLSSSTVTRRVESLAEHLRRKLDEDLLSCEYFSVGVDEATDSADATLVVVFVRMAFRNFEAREEMLTLVPVKEKSADVDVFGEFKKYVADERIPINKVVSVMECTPSKLVKHFVESCERDPDFPPFITYCSVERRKTLYEKNVDFEHVTRVVTKVANYIRSKAFKRCEFKSLLDELDPNCEESSDNSWVSKGKALQKFINIIPEIKLFLDSKNERYDELADKMWLLDLAFLTDLTQKLDEINNELQERNKTITSLIYSINSFKVKTNLWMSQMKINDLQNFQNMRNFIRAFECSNEHSNGQDQFRINTYVNYLKKMKDEFDRIFQDLKKIEPIVMFVSNPFMDINVSDFADRVEDLLHIDNSIFEMEVITLQSDLHLKAKGNDFEFWKLVDQKKYPLLVEIALKVKAFFGSTHFCESALTEIKLIKSKCHSNVSNNLLNSCIRVGVSNYEPDFLKLAESMQCQVSH